MSKIEKNVITTDRIMASNIRKPTIENITSGLAEKQAAITAIIRILTSKTVMRATSLNKQLLKNYIKTGTIDALKNSGFKYIVCYLEKRDIIDHRSLRCAEYIYGYNHGQLMVARQKQRSGVFIANELIERDGQASKYIHRSAEVIVTTIMKQGDNALTSTAVIKALQQNISPITQGMIDMIDRKKIAETQFIKYMIPILVCTDANETLKDIMDIVIRDEYAVELDNYITSQKIVSAALDYSKIVAYIDYPAAPPHSAFITRKRAIDKKIVQDAHDKFLNVFNRARAALNNLADEDERFIWTITMDTLFRSLEEEHNTLLYKLKANEMHIISQCKETATDISR